MNILRRVSFELWYLRQPPWETGIVPPEVETFISTHKIGLALDIGCGSGTSSLALARASWSVSGVDFTWGAIRRVRKKARLAGLTVDLHRADVADLPASLRLRSYDLVLDIGCFHGLDGCEQSRYLVMLPGLLAPGGNWLIYGFFVKGEQIRLPSEMSLTWRQNGLEKGSRPSAWMCFTKPSIHS